jgi:hypothetical protein
LIEVGHKIGHSFFSGEVILSGSRCQGGSPSPTLGDSHSARQRIQNNFINRIPLHSLLNAGHFPEIAN